MEGLEQYRYICNLASRWRLIVISATGAAVLAFSVSMLLPREYTATARILIEPPAGTDLRAAMAVSPIYLESLRTYEHFATSDSLFQKALERFHLRQVLGSRPIESLKKRVLEVALVRSTRILEISATLPDPAKAKGLATFLADSTVDLNHSLVADGDHDLLRALQDEEAEARARLDGADAEWARVVSSEPIEELRTAGENSAELRAKIGEQLAEAEVALADALERQKHPDQRYPQVNEEVVNDRVRLAQMRTQLADLDRAAGRREQILATRSADRDRADADRKAAQAALTAVQVRLREARADAGYRGERLRVVDPGIVPERPSFPNVPLNVAVALLAGLVLPALYIAMGMNFPERRTAARRAVRLQSFARHE